MFEVALTAFVTLLASFLAFIGSRKNKDLESVITALNIIIEEQRQEIDALRKRIEYLEKLLYE